MRHSGLCIATPARIATMHHCCVGFRHVPMHLGLLNVFLDEAGWGKKLSYVIGFSGRACIRK